MTETLAGSWSNVPLEKAMSVPSRVLATYPLCAFLYSQSLRPFLPKGSYGYSARQQLKILLQKRSLAVVGSSDEVYLMDFRFAFLFLTQILTQIADKLYPRKWTHWIRPTAPFGGHAFDP